MEQKEYSRNIYAGAFFIIGIILIGVVVLTIGIEKGITQPKFQMQVFFREVGGLIIGSPIRLSGVNVGTVAKIDFIKEEVDGRNVAVTLNLFSRYRDQIEQGYNFRIKTEGVLGQKFIEISKDKTGQKKTIDFKNPIIGEDFKNPIIGEDPLDVQDLANTFGATAISLQQTARATDAMMLEIKERFKGFKRTMNRVEERMIDGTLFKVF
ncbi:MAG: MCE family protein [Candidatus Omnitrophica bacterium]|nr:MCE family protein [Candidatus Omnitrophota bacterium]